jgi:hypothetical protein
VGGRPEPLNYSNDDGDIQIGGGGAVTIVNAPHLTVLGVPNGILDGQSFTIDDGVRVRQFEFDANGKSTPGNAVIRFRLDDSASAMSGHILARIAEERYGWDLTPMGGGVMRFEGHDVDGVFVDGVPTPGATVTLLVTASAPGMLDGWFDFNNDGDFQDQFEHVYASYSLQAGINEVPLTIPANASIGPRFARFRFSSQGGLAPTGLAVDGEVEDYLIQIYGNSPPVVTVPVERILLEDISTPIPGISVFDNDAGQLPITVTFSVLRGTLSVDPWVPGGVSVTGVDYQDNNRVVILTGSQTQINTTLSSANGLVYQSNLDYNGPELLTVVADDGGNSGVGGPWQDRRTIPLTVLPVNDPPVITLLDGTVDEDLPQSITGVQVTDVDVLEGDPEREDYGILTVVLAVEALNAETAPDMPSTAAGTMAVAADVNGGLPADAIEYSEDGVHWTEWTPTGRASLVRMRGTEQQINTTLASADGLTYQGAENVYGYVQLSVFADDNGQWPPDRGESTSQASSTITIVSINDAPVATVPDSGSMTANRNRPLNMAGFDAADVDSGPFPITVMLVVDQRSDGGSDNGTLRFVDTSALNFAEGDSITPSEALTGQGASVVTISAPVARMSALLSNPAAWQYLPPTGFAGEPGSTDPSTGAWEILTVTVNDGGFTGNMRDSGGNLVPSGPLSDTQSVTLFVQDVNEPPVITAPTAASVDEDEWLHFTGSNAVSVSDADWDRGMGDGLIRVTVSTSAGTVATDSQTPAVSITLHGTLAEVNASLATLRFRGNLNFNGTTSVTILADDLGNWPPPAEQTTHTVAITVNPVNDPPMITMPGPLSVLENQSRVIPSVSVTDVDAFEGGSDGVLTVRLRFPSKRSLASQRITLNVAADVPNGLPASAIRYSTDGVTIGRHRSGPVRPVDRYAGPINATLAAPTAWSSQVLRTIWDGRLTVFADDGGQWPPDNGESTSQASQIITIQPNRPVVANPVGQVNVQEDAPDRFIELYPGVFDYAGNGTLTFSVTQNTNTSLVTATITGTTLRLRFLPNQSGTSTISVTASDGQHFATDTFTVNVTQVPDPPFVANPIPDVLVDAGQATYTVELQDVFDDPDIPFGDALTISFNNASDNTNPGVVSGTLINQDSLRLTFTGTAGRAVLTVHACDLPIAGQSRCTSDRFTVIVNALPTARDDQATTSMHVPVTIQVTANDTDADGTFDPSSVQIVPGSGPLRGTATVNAATGAVDYTPNLGYWNRNHPRHDDRPLDTFRYTVQDDRGAVSNEATVTVTVNWRPVYQNALLPEDVNGDGFVSPIDVLILINYVNDRGNLLPDELTPPELSYPPTCRTTTCSATGS